MSLILCGLFLEGCPWSATGDDENKLSILIWGHYIAPETLKEFEAQTGIKVQSSVYDSNEALLAKVHGGIRGFDLAVPSDYMVKVMTELGLLSQLELDQIPLTKHIDRRFMGRTHDPHNSYSIPYAWTTVGIAYRQDLYQEPVKNWDDLFYQPSLRGKVSLLDDARETLGASLKSLGYSLNTTVAGELVEAKARLIRAKTRLRAFSSAPVDLLARGDVWLAMMYNQEAEKAKEKLGDKLAFVWPEEGQSLSVDHWVILKGAPNPKAAHLFINFLLDPERYQKNLTALKLGSVEKADPTVPWDKLESIEDLGSMVSQYEDAWSAVKAADF